MSCVYGSVANNNWFWIEWLDLLPPPLQSLKSQSITITHNNLQPDPSSMTA